MYPIEKAIWYIESHFDEEISLDEVACVAGLSKFHLCRSFSVITGRSFMRYARARRLSEAAKRLAENSASILHVALDSGYHSHEAFTRAFREQFGMSPDQFRKTRDIDSIEIVEPMKMDERLIDTLPEPKFIVHGPIHIVGLKKRYNDETIAQAPSQWQKFVPYIGTVANQLSNAAYGVLCNSDDNGNIDYLTGVEVSDPSDIPKELGHLLLAPQTYAVFPHRSHVSQIRHSWQAIFSKWCTAAGREMIDAPQFERYGENFDAQTGIGEIEIWIPIKE